MYRSQPALQPAGTLPGTSEGRVGRLEHRPALRLADSTIGNITFGRGSAPFHSDELEAATMATTGSAVVIGPTVAQSSSPGGPTSAAVCARMSNAALCSVHRKSLC